MIVTAPVMPMGFERIEAIGYKNHRATPRLEHAYHFARRLAIQLLAYGLSPFALEMDNYFVDRERTPRDADGQFDYEALDALDRPLLSEHLRQLISGEEVRLPHYEFKTGKSGPGDLIKLAKDGQFPSGNYFGAVGLAPFHDFERKIPQDVKDKLEEIDAGLKDGSISTGY